MYNLELDVDLMHQEASKRTFGEFNTFMTEMTEVQKLAVIMRITSKPRLTRQYNLAAWELYEQLRKVNHFALE